MCYKAASPLISDWDEFQIIYFGWETKLQTGLKKKTYYIYYDYSSKAGSKPSYYAFVHGYKMSASVLIPRCACSTKPNANTPQ